MAAINSAVLMSDCKGVEYSGKVMITHDCPCPEDYRLRAIKSVVVYTEYAHCYTHNFVYVSTAALIGAVLNPYLIFHQYYLPQDFNGNTAFVTRLTALYSILSGITFAFSEGIICRETSKEPIDVYELVRECHLKDESSE